MTRSRLATFGIMIGLLQTAGCSGADEELADADLVGDDVQETGSGQDEPLRPGLSSGAEGPPPIEVPVTPETGEADAPSSETCVPGNDADGDGQDESEGDCDDCNANIYLGAYDAPGNMVDEDCSGVPDDAALTCEANVQGVDDPSAESAAAAIGLCTQMVEEESDWGLVSVQYTRADGSPDPAALSHGILRGFGDVVTPREGELMLALSSGTARAPGQAGYFSPDGYVQGTMGATPDGFMSEAPACPGTRFETKALDSTALDLNLVVPPHAHSLSFDFNFFTFEYPEYICSEFNDFFVVLMDPPPEEQETANISFDNLGNPVSVNNGFLEVCAPGRAGGKDFSCPQGTDALAGTGFENHAATGWLTTTVPVKPGQELRLRFMIWDAGDPILDSTVLIDRLRFSVDEVETVFTEPADPIVR